MSNELWMGFVIWTQLLFITLHLRDIIKELKGRKEE